MTDRTIAYQGEPGANSHIICAEAYPDWTPLSCPTFEDAFAAEIAAVGTHLQQFCAQCGESFTEQRYACQKSPVREACKTEKETR